MWIPVLIIALVAAMAVGPVMWFRSTPYQRRIVDVRDRANQLGLRVRLTPLSELGVSGEGAREHMVAGYGLAWIQPGQDDNSRSRGRPGREWCLVKERISHEAHFSGWWDWRKGRQADKEWHEALRALLPNLPADTIALESNQQALCLYWDEKGRPEQVDRVASVLNSLRQHGLDISQPTREEK